MRSIALTESDPCVSVQYPLPLTFSNQYSKPAQSTGQAEPTNAFASLVPTIQYEIHSLRDDQKRHLKEISRVKLDRSGNSV